MLFEVKEVDKKFYEEKLRDFLPEKIIDFHTHVWLKEFEDEGACGVNRTVSWPGRVARDNSVEDLIETYRLMFDGKTVTPLIFSTPQVESELERANEYIRESALKYDLPSLLLIRPGLSGEELEDKIFADGFLGVKVYLSYADRTIAGGDITIFDFLPLHQLEVLNRLGLIVMLHLPRALRLRDKTNLEQMLEIEKKFPNVKLIIAHVGRAYCREDVGDAFEVLAGTQNMMFDISANTNAWVFEQLIKAVGPRRILFGSDMPILRMRMRRVCENGNYVNIVPRGLYGDVSGDKNMREVEGKEADKLSFFMYEEIEAFRQAAIATNLTADDIKDVFYNNAYRTISESRGK